MTTGCGILILETVIYHPFGVYLKLNALVAVSVN